MSLTRPVAVIQGAIQNTQSTLGNQSTTMQISRRTWPFACFFFVVCLLAAAMPALAQLQAGRIVGQVFDPQHASVAGATITVTDPATKPPPKTRPRTFLRLSRPMLRAITS